jgi:hypothetical protein
LTANRCLLIAFVATACLWSQVYEGPAVLARGSGGGARPYGQRAGRNSRIRVSADLTAIYDTGFVPYELDAQGNLFDPGALVGYEVALAAFGTKKSRFGSFGLDYRGTFRHYPNNQRFAGTDHFAGLEIRHQQTRRITLEGHTTAGTSNRVFSFGNLLVGSNLANFLPVNEVFDNRVYFLQGGASLNYQISGRSSITAGADAFAIRRATSGLIGVNGYTPRLGYGYRLTRRIQIGAVYAFQHFDYARAFGESDVHQLNGVFAYDFSSRWSLEIGAGAFRSDSAGTRTVQADPVLRRLLGQDTIVESFSAAFTRPTINASLRGNFKRSSVVGSFGQSASGGNGLTLLGQTQMFMLNYSYQADKRLSLGVTSNLTRLTSLSNNVGGNFGTYLVAGSANYFLSRSLGLTGTAFYRSLGVPQTNNALRNSFRISVGVVWSPNDFGLPVF